MKAVSFARPINRIGFILFCMGVLLIVVSVLATIEERYDGLRIARVYDLLLDRQRFWWQFTFRLSLALIFFGAWIAWLYDPTIGRVVRWVRSGNWK